MSPTQAERARLFRAVHAEASRRGLDHDAVRDVCRETYGVHSMGELSEGQLLALYKAWTGHTLRRKVPLPKRGCLKVRDEEMVSGDDLETLGRAFALRGWGKDTQAAFIRRQLGGRAQIRTKKDFWRVFSGVRAMNRRSAA